MSDPDSPHDPPNEVREGEAAEGARNLDAVVAACAPHLLALARLLTRGDRDLAAMAEDIVQEVFLSELGQPEALRGASDEKLHGMLRTRLYARIVDSRRKARSAGEVELDSLEDPRWRRDRERELQEQRIEELLGPLPGDLRAILEAWRRGSRKWIEVGSDLGKSENAVRVEWSRAVAELRARAKLRSMARPSEDAAPPE